MSTASGSGGSTPWTSWWSTTKRPPSSPASTGRSSTSSERFNDALSAAPATSRPWCRAHFPRAEQMTPRRHGRSRALPPGARSVQSLIPYWLPLPGWSYCPGRLFPSSSPLPSLTPRSRPPGSWPILENGSGERGEFIHFIPSPLETALLWSTCSRYQHPSVRRHWARLERTKAAIDEVTYVSGELWALAYQAAQAKVPSPSSPICVLCPYLAPRLSREWTHLLVAILEPPGGIVVRKLSSAFGAVLAIKKEFPWRPVCKRDRWLRKTFW